MSTKVLLTLAAIASAWLGTPARAATVPANLGNLWDKANGTTVTAGSPTDDFFVSHSANLLNMFTPKDNFDRPAEDDRFNLLFGDQQPGGFVHFVEWQTPTPVTLGHFKLYAINDRPSVNRSFDRFTLYAWNGTAFVSIFNSVPAHPYVFDDQAHLALFDRAVTQVTTDRFRAEFTQNGTPGSGYLGNTTYGPRVIEIAGFVPEPGTGLALLGVIVVAARRRRAGSR